MFKRILIPLDGSSRAEQALPIATHLAQASEGSLVLVNVVNIAQEAMSYGIGGVFVPPDTLENAVRENQAYLSTLVERTRLTGLAAVEQQVIVGNPTERIIQAAWDERSDLVIMVSHGSTGLRQWLMGSIAERVAHHSPVPVLILREGEPLHMHLATDGNQVIRALVPLDPSVHANQDAIVPIANMVGALSSPGQGVLHLLQMMVLPKDASQSERTRLLVRAQTRLGTIGLEIRESLRRRLSPAVFPTITWSISTDPDIAEGIARIAENGEETEHAGRMRRYDMIAMTTHSLSGLQKWIPGSTTDRVLHMTRLPLLVVRPAEAIARDAHDHIRPERMHV